MRELCLNEKKLIHGGTFSNAPTLEQALYVTGRLFGLGSENVMIVSASSFALGSLLFGCIGLGVALLAFKTAESTYFYFTE